MIVEVAVLIIVALVMLLIFKFLKRIVFFVLNSVVGLLALIGFNQFFDTTVTINVWSLVIAGIGGSIGFAIIIIIHYFGLAF
ncbi:hypothetical protein CMO90_01640 [Candidatus Woesearchaeota archaeon]|jgi:hypothetical protein|nr:hypothetical protein [Candidatus Woesearchaeota archaeon]|tara:strand:- start:1113 stop:1358 length:246 start_codon:yes stop_codon:yes gene_type:complete